MAQQTIAGYCVVVMDTMVLREGDLIGFVNKVDGKWVAECETGLFFRNIEVGKFDKKAKAVEALVTFKPNPKDIVRE